MLSVSLGAGLAFVLAGLVAWTFTRAGQQTNLGLLYLGVAIAGLGCAYHHWWRNVYPADDIGNFATSEPRPVHLRGCIAEEPIIHLQPPEEDLLSLTRTDATVGTLRVTALDQAGAWQPASGLARLIVAGHWQTAHVGDAVELVGRLIATQGAANPGEEDRASALLDQRIRATVVVRRTEQAILRRPDEDRPSATGFLMRARAWAGHRLDERLAPSTAGLARALLLGDSSGMSSLDWDRYKRTGVIHALAISGLHLVILAAFLWWTCRLLTIRRKHIAWLVAGFILLYAVMTGARPPILRAAVTVSAYCVGIYLRRPALGANVLALAWLVVSIVNPTDLAGAGCQLSFLAVVVLCWAPWRWFPKTEDPLDHHLLEVYRAPWRRGLRRVARAVGLMYLVTLTVWATAAPLVMAHYHVLTPAALLIGPPVMALTAMALISGFMTLAASALCPVLVGLPAVVLRGSLSGSDWLVQRADHLPGGHFYGGDVSPWWLWGFYLGLILVLTQPALRVRWRWALAAGAGWFCIGLADGIFSHRPAGELRCTFLAVGRGGCTVLELPDGRTVLYDTGAMGGPELTRRQVAPFLWHEGIRRVDEVWISHADLDHFNGLPALLERFAVGQVTLTPSFSEKQTPGVPAALDAIRWHGVPVRTVHAGDRLDLGDVQVDVLHPPSQGPEGNENSRSLVLLVHHAEHTLLLTGDLEGPGLQRVLSLPAPRIDVLMAPHHGSHIANTPDLADWAAPRLVIASQGPPLWPAAEPNPYEKRGIPYLGTWPHGAISIISRPGLLRVETFRTRQSVVLSAPS